MAKIRGPSEGSDIECDEAPNHSYGRHYIPTDTHTLKPRDCGSVIHHSCDSEGYFSHNSHKSMKFSIDSGNGESIQQRFSPGYSSTGPYDSAGKCDSLGLSRLDISDEKVLHNSSETYQKPIQLREHCAHTGQRVFQPEKCISNERTNSNQCYSDEGFCSAGSNYIQAIQLKEHIPSRRNSSRTDSGINSLSLQSTPEEDLFNQNEDGDTVMHLCIIEEEYVQLQQFLSQTPHHSYLNIQNHNLQTPLHLAVIQNLPHVARRLISFGATIDIRDRSGNTALHLACARSRFECVLALTTCLERRDIEDVPYTVPFQRLPQNQDIKNYEGKTCLHLAADNSNLPIVNHLLTKCGADINAREGKAGETILHQAIQRANNENLVNHLLSHYKCNVNEIRYDGRSAYQIAYALKLHQMMAILRTAGAQTNVESDDDEEMMDVEEEESINGSRPITSQYLQRNLLLPKTPPRDDDFLYDDIKIGGELIKR